MSYAKISQSLKPSSKQLLVILIILLFTELWFLPTGECKQNEKPPSKEDCLISNVMQAVSGSLMDFFDDHGGGIAAMATIVIAIYTYTLFRATSGLQILAESQAGDMKVSLEIANKSANALIEQTKHLQVFAEATERLVAITEQARRDASNRR